MDTRALLMASQEPKYRRDTSLLTLRRRNSTCMRNEGREAGGGKIAEDLECHGQ